MKTGYASSILAVSSCYLSWTASGAVSGWEEEKDGKDEGAGDPGATFTASDADAAFAEADEAPDESREAEGGE